MLIRQYTIRDPLNRIPMDRLRECQRGRNRTHQDQRPRALQVVEQMLVVHSTCICSSPLILIVSTMFSAKDIDGSGAPIGTANVPIANDLRVLAPARLFKTHATQYCQFPDSWLR